ncbi:hypothetical protein GCM10025872_14950 [Barrientosiimonas endolithica]|uniref:GP-PDE domain-containing protein n=1 Tax=Barrientosiimonas endolithica TaxID=1535208 RepID=A0ABN6YKG9_9MICO|nr:hypothetical protein GCM10025872_14950 [Barrientosiimonas endolithica]
MARTAYLEHDGPIAMAHRGFSTDGLENTMAAFEAAVGLGFGYVETDVHATADRVLLAFHDETLDRVTDGAGSIWDQPWHRVREARIGGTEQIPTLDELFETWPRLRVNIDIKSEPAVLPLVECVERHRAWDRVCVTSFSDRRRRAALRRLSKPVATSGGQSVTTAFVLAANSRVPGAVRAALRGVDCLQVPVSQGDSRRDTAHHRGRARRRGAGARVDRQRVRRDAPTARPGRRRTDHRPRGPAAPGADRARRMGRARLVTNAFGARLVTSVFERDEQSPQEVTGQPLGRVRSGARIIHSRRWIWMVLRPSGPVVMVARVPGLWMSRWSRLNRPGVSGGFWLCLYPVGTRRFLAA